MANNTATKVVELGDRVRDKVTGQTGIVTQRVENLNGCIQFTVRPPVKADGSWNECYCIDVENLEIIKKGAVVVQKRVGGGENSRPAKSA